MTAPQEMTKEHELKCWPEYFSAIVSGEKTFEIRQNDRGFYVGDILRLREWSPITEQYTGNETKRRVTYVTAWGQKMGVIVMGIEPIASLSADRVSVPLALLNRLLDVTAPGASGGMTEMNSREGRLAFYERLRPVRDELLDAVNAAPQPTEDSNER